MIICKNVLILSSFCVILMATGWTDTPYDESESVAEKFTIHSEVLSEDRSFWVSIPAGYTDPLFAKSSYPVIYMLDGDAFQKVSSGMLAWMGAAYSTPLAIVVYIDTLEQRLRDLTPTFSLIGYRGSEQAHFSKSGGGDKFLDFLASELIPLVEANYRTANHRTIIGHSLGGLIVAYSFLSRPELFNGYISIDGSFWWDDQIIAKKAEVRPLGEEIAAARFYLSIAAYPTDKPSMKSSHTRFVKGLLINGASDSSLILESFDDETHMSVVPLSIYYGLRYVFVGHRPAYGWHSDLPDLDQIESHFEKLSDLYGFEYLPPESLVDNLAWQWVGSDSPESKNALFKFLNFNASLYPASSNAQASLGRAYSMFDDKQSARKHLINALMINEKNELARNELEKLKNQ